MVRLQKTLIAVLSLISIISTQAEGRIVSHVKIDKVGAAFKGDDDENTKRDCAVFRPTKQQIIHFFNSAKESEESGSLLHEYYSPCISTGSVTFKDGLSGAWVLQSSGLASFISNGKELTFFTRDNKWEDPFGCVYGLDDEPSC